MVILFYSFYKTRIPLGELIQNTRTFVHPGNGVLYTFRTQWEYDSWNRTSFITYADGEVVEYQYDNGGMLRHMSGTKGNDHYPYVDEIRYDKFGSRTHIAYGNGSYTHYTCEADMRRLSRLETWDAGQNLMQDLAYTYDNTNNITELSNSAADVNGMGGVYQYYFAYDDLYRLSTAYGEFDGKMFNLAMQYSPNGQILEKELMADFSIAGNNYSKQYNNAYNYTAGRNAPQEVVDQFTNYHTSLKWDSNGNLVHQDESELSRNLCWDEENRLTTVKDERQMSAYLYDHAGERVWKMSGEVQTMTISGQTVIDYVALDRKTLYTNPYLIVTEAEYTKHYYAESQRIASKLGGGWANALVDPLQDHLTDTVGYEYTILNGWLVEGMGKNAECVGMDPNYVLFQDGFDAVYHQHTEHDFESSQYFYHPDHLGSSSFITNASGDVDQHLQYLPFGEPWIDQRTQNNIRFTFSGKERDDETGYNYFGARYYNSDVSIWLSVDPLSDKYPSLSPYTYCANNPIMLVDPDGRHIEESSQSEWNSQKGTISRVRDYLQSGVTKLENKAIRKGWSQEELDGKMGNLKERVGHLNETLETMTIMEQSDQCYSLSDIGHSSYGEVTFSAETGIINLAYRGTANFVHEVTHGGQFEKGEIAFSIKNGKGYMDLGDERMAYTKQLAFDPYSLKAFGISNKDQLTDSWFDGLNINGIPLYFNHSSKSFGINDPFPYSGFNGAALKDIDGVYFKK